jgi:predicted oxidoreductase
MDLSVTEAFDAAPDEVAAVMFDPAEDPRWMGGVRKVEMFTPGPLAVGSEVRRRGVFLGRRFSWDTQVVALEPARRLEMRFISGPMTGGVAYLIDPKDGGSLVCIRNSARSRFDLPGVGLLAARVVRADLRRLRDLVKSRRPA